MPLYVYFLFLLYIYDCKVPSISNQKRTQEKKINESKFAKRKIIWHKWKESWFLISDLCELTKYILVASVFCFLYFFFFILSFKGACIALYLCLWIKIHRVRVWGVFSFSYLLFHFIRHEFSIFIFFFWFYYCHFVLQSIDGARVLTSLQLNHFLFIFYLIFTFLLVEIRSLKTSMSFFAIRVLFVISMSELLIWLRISSQPLSFTWCISFFSHTHRSGGFFLNVYILHWLSLLLFLLVLFYFVCQFSSGSFLG